MTRLSIVAALFVCAAGLEAGAPAATPPPAPSRIVSLVPAVTKTLFAFGAGPQVVGVSDYDRDPPAAAALPRVGGLIDPDTERILTLRPDLVVVYDGQQELEMRLRRAGIAIFRYRHGGLADALATIRTLGAAVGRPAAAGALASRIERALAAVAARVAGRPRPPTLLVIGRDPGTLRHIIASGGYGFLHDMLVVAGGGDVFADVTRENVAVSLEQVLARRPEAIVELRYGAGGGPSDHMGPWQRLTAVPAVSTGRLYELTGDEFVEAGPHIADATEKLSRVLQPEAWRQ